MAKKRRKRPAPGIVNDEVPGIETEEPVTGPESAEEAPAEAEAEETPAEESVESAEENAETVEGPAAEAEDSAEETAEETSEEAEEEPEETEEAEEPADETPQPAEELPGAGFEETVEYADVSQIKNSYKGKKSRVLSAAFFVRLVLLALCGALFMYSAVSIAERFADDIKSEDFISTLQSNANERSAVQRQMKSRALSSPLCLYDALGVTEYTPEFIEPEVSDKYDSILNQISQLRNINPEIYGWIRCTGGMLGINYPVYKHDDNDYYLRRNIYGEYSVAGTIYVDYRDSDRHGESFNTIFYGHNMTNGTMFRAIKDWFDSPERNSTAPLINVEIITPQAAYVYEIFSAYRSDGAEFITVSFRDTAAYKSFLKSIIRKSVLGSKSAYDENTRIITLCTCTNSGKNEDERYVIHCKLVKIVKYN